MTQPPTQQPPTPPGKLRMIAGGAPPPPPPSGGGGPPSDFWTNLMTMTRTGYANTVHNVMLVLRNDWHWKDVLCHDDFAQRLVFMKPPPFHADYKEQDISVRHDPHAHTTRNIQRFLGKEVNDVDLSNTAAWIERSYKPMKPSSAMVGEAMESIARTNKKHPVRDMIAKEAWDGVERIGRTANPQREGDAGSPSWLTTHFGAEDCDYTRKIGRWWLISAVARIMKPGCQADYALILEGKQGVGKSQGLRALTEPWFSEDLGDINHIKESQQQLAGLWLVELAELDAFSRVTDAAIKKFLSQPFDRYRPPYGKRPRDYPRQCIFAATTNKRSYLRDVTGNRRYWPVWTTFADVDGLREHRAQIWAEALVLYNAGHVWWPQAEDHTLLVDHQDDRMEQDPWLDPLAEWLDARDGQGRSAVSVADALTALQHEKARWTPADEKRIGKIMQVLGRVRVRRVLPSGVRTYVYDKPAIEGGEEPLPPVPPPGPAPPPQKTFSFESDPPYDPLEAEKYLPKRGGNG